MVRPLPTAFAKIRTNSSKAAFTLIEILITVALIGLVLAMAAGTLITTSSSATRMQLRADQEAELLRVVSSMRRQIITIATSSATQSPVDGEVGRDPHTDWLDIVTSSLMFTRGVGRAEWRIIVTPDATPYLAYRESPWVGGENIHNNPWIPFSRMISGMRVRYWSNPSYVDGWHQNSVPERIQVFLYYTDSDVPASFMFEAMPGIGGSSGAAITTSPSGGPSGSPSPAASPSTGPSGAPSASPSNSPSFGAPSPSSSAAPSGFGTSGGNSSGFGGSNGNSSGGSTPP